MKTWILVANSSEAVLYEGENLRTDEMITFVKRFSHQESREKGDELVCDRPGHFKTDHSARSAYEKNDPKDLEAENFARELIATLHLGCNTHEFDHLVLVASPSFLGILQNIFSCKTPALKIDHIAKDYTQLTPGELIIKIREHIFPAE